MKFLAPITTVVLAILLDAIQWINLNRRLEVTTIQREDRGMETRESMPVF